MNTTMGVWQDREVYRKSLRQTMTLLVTAEAEPEQGPQMQWIP